MSNTPPNPPARPGWLPGSQEPFPAPEASDPPANGDEVLPTWDVPETVIPVATPVTGDEGDAPLAQPVPLAEPVEAEPAEAPAEAVAIAVEEPAPAEEAPA